MKLAIPRIWRQPTDHSSNCYFFMVDPTKRQTGKNAPQSVYPIFLLPLPQYHTAPSCQFPLPQRGISHFQETAASQTARKILEIQITVSQMRLMREGHTSLTRKTSAIWSEALVLQSQCWASDTQAQAVELVGRTRASPRSEKASPNIFQLLQSVRWAVLLQQCGRSIRSYRYYL